MSPEPGSQYTCGNSDHGVDIEPPLCRGRNVTGTSLAPQPRFPSADPKPRSRAGFSFLGRAIDQRALAHASTGERSDQTRLGRGLLCSDLSTTPRNLSAAQSKERAQRATMRRRRLLPADPVRPAEHRSNRRGAQRTRPWSRTANAVLASGQNYAESPQLRLALTNARQGVAFEGGVGARGRAARPTNCGGKL